MITNKDLYEAIDKMRLELKADLKTLKVEVDANTGFRHQLTGKLTVLFIFIGVGVNFLMDWGRNKLTQ